MALHQMGNFPIMKTVLTTPTDPIILVDIDLSSADAVVVDTSGKHLVAGKVLDETFVADFIVHDFPNSDFFSEFGALYRMIGKAMDLKISKVVMSMPAWEEDTIYKQHLILLSDGTYLYDIEKRNQEIAQITMTHNIIPTDTYETLPVEHKYGFTPEKYGCVVELDIEPIDPERLRTALDEWVNGEKPHYVSDRLQHFLVPAPEVINYLKYVGFTNETYSSHPLNVQGTAEIDPSVPDYVRFVYSQVESKIFRHNYVISKNGWEIIWHKDQSTPVMHGFRLMVPIDPVVMDFEKGRYILTPGKYYFVNNSLLHKGVIPEGYSIRANLLGQMASDVDVLRGTVML
jgi:hypothetical protein